MAIGDGANDVSMIQAAHVGVGISGMEGRQAVMASDFAISKFKYLERLILVHGHWNLDRLSRMILYFFFKNAVSTLRTFDCNFTIFFDIFSSFHFQAFVFLQFWFQLFAGFSGTVIFDQLYLYCYNLMWTSLPPIVIGALDKVAEDSVLESNPHLYSRGRLGQLYTTKLFWINIFEAFYVSTIVFYITYGAYQGLEAGVLEFGTTALSAHLAVMFLNLAVETKSWVRVFA